MGVVVLVFGGLTVAVAIVALISFIIAAIFRRLPPLYFGIGVAAGPIAAVLMATTGAAITEVQTVSLLEARAIGEQHRALFDCANVEGIPISECAALVAFYEAKPRPFGDWLTSDTPCAWPGLGCTDGHVSVLSWPNLPPGGGKLPPELGDLTELRILDVRNTGLTGPIPPELGRLTKLEQLRLGQNQLTGPIPAEFGGMTALKYLALNTNQLTGPIPAELGGLTNLEQLWLNQNGLTGPIPPELGRLTDLQEFWLYVNQLSGSIPAEIGGMSALTSLSLNENGLTGPIPPELGGLTNLETLRLNHNQLSGSIPPELGRLTKLGQLGLNENALTGPIPLELGNLSTLTLFDVDDSQLQLDGNNVIGGIPPGLESVCFRGGGYSNCRRYRE
jgi:hypothetical protein